MLWASSWAVTGDHVIWSNHGFPGGKLMQRVAGLGLLILGRVLFGSHSEPPVITQNCCTSLKILDLSRNSRWLPLPPRWE